MRIISGTLKGRRFHPPQKIPTRPTTDFAKEGLFNILENYFDLEAVSFLDLFAGTGSISYEFASRGCEDITTIERFPKCAAFIRKTAEAYGMEAIEVLQMDVFQYLRNCPRQFDLIFAGPPYKLENLDTLPDLIFEYGLLQPEGWFILEHSPQHDFSKHPHLLSHRNYGKTIFSIFSEKDPED